jgi:hypothetical protein
LAGVSKTIAAVAIATADQISNGRLEIFKKIINLLTVTVLFLFTFFTLILDAPRNLAVASGKGNRFFTQKLYVQVANKLRSPQYRTKFHL